MSKKIFKRATAHNRVQAVPVRVIRDKNGAIVKTFYDIYGPEYLKR